MVEHDFAASDGGLAGARARSDVGGNRRYRLGRVACPLGRGALLSLSAITSSRPARAVGFCARRVRATARAARFAAGQPGSILFPATRSGGDDRLWRGRLGGGASRREQRRMSYRSASARAVAFDEALREAMSATVPDTIDTQGAPASDPAAGTPGPEGVTVETVAADPAVSDPGSAPSDRDRVEHERKARLRRWQAVGERRT